MIIKLKDLLAEINLIPISHISDEEREERSQKKLMSHRITTRFREVESAEEAELINNQYTKYAIRAGINPTNLTYHLLSGNGIVWKAYNCNDYVVGQFIGDIFTVSHFAPETLGTGVDALRDLLHTVTPVVFAVPEKLAKQLSKIGFTQILDGLPMTFKDKVVDKTILINNAFNKKDGEEMILYWMEEAQKSGQIKTDLRTKEFFDKLKHRFSNNKSSTKQLPQTNEPKQKMDIHI